MAFKRLTTDDLKSILSQDEIDALNTFSLDPAKTTILNDTIDMIADTWRGALSAKGYALDVRDHYIPTEYAYWVLVHARYAIWSRFPMSPAIALDDARKDEYNKALELLKNPYIGASKPDWEYSPENPVNGGTGGGSIKLPFLRMDEMLYYWNAISAI